MGNGTGPHVHWPHRDCGCFVDGLAAEEVLLRSPSGRHVCLGCCVNRLWRPAQLQPVDDHPARTIRSYSPSRRRGNLCRTPQAYCRRNIWPSHQYPNEHRRLTLQCMVDPSGCAVSSLVIDHWIVGQCARRIPCYRTCPHLCAQSRSRPCTSRREGEKGLP